GERYVTSKINLYDTEMFVKSVMFFIGSMLSLIFLSAAMSILYFYLQTTLLQEKEKYMGIRKLGLSKKELSSVIAKELAILIFVPFTIAILLLLTILLAM
ncbi:MAG TPA: ABC transporter permease, partial [Lysinibacillus sp.]|nr:ABC transporter permease [Lysinibacillus sp.]